MRRRWRRRARRGRGEEDKEKKREKSQTETVTTIAQVAEETAAALVRMRLQVCVTVRVCMSVSVPCPSETALSGRRAVSVSLRGVRGLLTSPCCARLIRTRRVSGSPGTPVRVPRRVRCQPPATCSSRRLFFDLLRASHLGPSLLHASNLQRASLAFTSRRFLQHWF